MHVSTDLTTALIHLLYTRCEIKSHTHTLADTHSAAIHTHTCSELLPLTYSHLCHHACVHTLRHLETSGSARNDVHGIIFVLTFCGSQHAYVDQFMLWFRVYIYICLYDRYAREFPDTEHSSNRERERKKCGKLPPNGREQDLCIWTAREKFRPSPPSCISICTNMYIYIICTHAIASNAPWWGCGRERRQRNKGDLKSPAKWMSPSQTAQTLPYDHHTFIHIHLYCATSEYYEHDYISNTHRRLPQRKRRGGFCAYSGFWYAFWVLMLYSVGTVWVWERRTPNTIESCAHFFDSVFPG